MVGEEEQEVHGWPSHSGTVVSRFFLERSQTDCLKRGFSSFFWLGVGGWQLGFFFQRLAHSVAPPLREILIALIHGVNALRHRALAASGCPGPKVCRLYPAIEGCSTRST